MRKLLSISYTPAAFNLGILLLRIVSGALMMQHGYNKLISFAEKKEGFMDFLGMGSTASLSLVVFAEFFCALFLIIGLFTRLTLIPLIVAMSVALFSAHDADFFGDGEMATLFLGIFITLLLTGPGSISVDGLSSK